jgi:hypothetical protein
MFGKKQNERFVFRYIYFIFRDEIIAEYDGKMRDASEREEQFRKRIQPNVNTDTPKENQSTLSTGSSASSLSFHTPAIEQSPNDLKLSSISSEKMNSTETSDVISITPNKEIQTIIRHTATEETTEVEYRPGIKLVPSNVLKSTIQNYMMDHNSLDESQDEELPEKVYDWDAIISNGPQFKYDDAFGKLEYKSL